MWIELFYLSEKKIDKSLYFCSLMSHVENLIHLVTYYSNALCTVAANSNEKGRADNLFWTIGFAF